MARRSLNAALVRLAQEAGLSTRWKDAFGKTRRVSSETLEAILSTLGYPAESQAELQRSQKLLKRGFRMLPAMLVALPGERFRFPGSGSERAELTLEDGRSTHLPRRRGEDGGSVFEAPLELGYHTISAGNRKAVLAVAPPRAFFPQIGRKCWATAVQLYSLRGGKTRGFGDLQALRDFAIEIAKAGADAVAISPVHAPMQGADAHYSPYAPSSRLFLNSNFIAARSGTSSLESLDLIDWRRSLNAKRQALDKAYETFRSRKSPQPAFEAFAEEGGERLLCHARFEALAAKFGIGDWRRWPVPYRNVASRAVRALNRSDPDVERSLFCQWLAHEQLLEAQTASRRAGMRIGLITDLATGMNPGGSHSWSAQDGVLRGLTIGAPPDLFAPEGQNWGLTALSPSGMHADGYQSYLATLRACMRYAGGVRIDHAMGLQRLWVIPEGAAASDGAYLHYPFENLLRLLALESVRNRSLVIAEDLGTVAAQFREAMMRAGLLSMRVLWFERGTHGDFKGAAAWDPQGCALTTTHDLPTVAGWWTGRDIAWRSRASRNFKKGKAKAERARERALLWRALVRSQCGWGRMPKTTEAARVVDGSVQFVSKTPCRVAIVPIEDFVGLRNQPNLPGTIDEHPNWRRRLPCGNGLKSRSVKKRLEIMRGERNKT